MLSSQSQPQRTPNPLQLRSRQRLTGNFPGAAQAPTCSGLAPHCPFPPHPTPHTRPIFQRHLRARAAALRGPARAVRGTGPGAQNRSQSRGEALPSKPKAVLPLR